MVTNQFKNSKNKMEPVKEEKHSSLSFLPRSFAVGWTKKKNIYLLIDRN